MIIFHSNPKSYLTVPTPLYTAVVATLGTGRLEYQPVHDTNCMNPIDQLITRQYRHLIENSCSLRAMVRRKKITLEYITRIELFLVFAGRIDGTGHFLLARASTSLSRKSTVSKEMTYRIETNKSHHSMN